MDERDDSRPDEELRDVFGQAVDDGGITSHGRVGLVADRQLLNENRSSFKGLQAVAQVLGNCSLCGRRVRR